MNFSQFEELRKKTNFLLVQIGFSQFWTNEKFVKTENYFWKKLGKTKLVVRCHEQDIPFGCRCSPFSPSIKSKGICGIFIKITKAILVLRSKYIDGMRQKMHIFTF